LANHRETRPETLKPQEYPLSSFQPCDVRMP
jgi:hypothetical protein